MPEDNGNNSPAGEQGNNPPGSGGKTFTQAELDQIISDRLGRERQKYADYDDLKKAADKLKGIEQANLSETEKHQKKATEAEAKASEAEARLKETVLRMEIERQARKLGIVDEDAAYRLLDTSSIEYDEAGNPKNVEARLKELVKARPYLVPSAGTGSATNPPRGATGALALEDVKKMTPAEINQRWDEIQRVLAQ